MNDTSKHVTYVLSPSEIMLMLSDHDREKREMIQEMKRIIRSAPELAPTLEQAANISADMLTCFLKIRKWRGEQHKKLKDKYDPKSIPETN